MSLRGCEVRNTPIRVLFGLTVRPSDHFIGLLTLPIEKLRKGDIEQEWLPLTAKGLGSVGDSAAIHLDLEYKPGYSSFVGPHPYLVFREVLLNTWLGALNVTVVEAVRLVDDPEYERPSTYCKLELISKSTDNKKERDKTQRTTVVKKSDSPKWKETLPCKMYELPG